MKTIIRVKRQPGNFTIIPNDVLRGKMSFRSKGLLCLILSCTEDWVVTKAWAAQYGTEGREALRASFDELVEFGYASVEKQGNSEAGRFTQEIWTFTDQPHRVPEVARNESFDRGREVAQNEPFSAESRQRLTDDGNPKNEPFSAGSRRREADDGKPSLQNTIEEYQLTNICGGAAKERQRNPLLDTLAQVCGMDTSCMTADEWAKVGIAIATITKAQPNVTVKDIQSHAANYRTLFKDATLTPLALRSHWGATASKSSLRGLSSQSGVHTPNDLKNLREKIYEHYANPRFGTMFAGDITPKMQEQYDQMVARYAEMSQTEGGK